jgi:hypothetical protein
VLDWLATSGESYLSLHPIREIKNISKDVAQEWLEDNKKFREEAKVLLFCSCPNRFHVPNQMLYLFVFAVDNTRGSNSNRFFSSVSLPLQEIRDKVKLLLQLADTLLSSGNNVHTQAIRHWSDNVDLKYKDFSCRIDQLKYNV